MKSVPNFIFYIHEFSRNFSQHLATCFELFSSGSIFNSKYRCHGFPPVSLSLSAPGLLVSTPSPHGCHVPAPASTPRHKGAVGTAPCSRLDRRPPTRQPLASPHALPDSRVRACHAAIAFTASAQVSAPHRRVFKPSRSCSPLFRHRLHRLTTPPSFRVGHPRATCA
jgi:hypothetical protein